MKDVNEVKPRDPSPSAASDVRPVGGAVRRVAILTVQLEPVACYLARRLRSSGVEVFLISQKSVKVEVESAAYFRRLLRRRGWAVYLDNILMFAVKSLIRLPLRWARGLKGLRGGGASSDYDSGRRPTIYSQSAAAALRPDSGITRESWLTFLEVDNINRDPDLARLREIGPDLILLAGAPILTRRTIEIPTVACINPHCGITPDYAGCSPFNRAIYEGRFDDIGYTIHLVVPKVDAGPVLHQSRVQWDPTKSNGHLWPLLAQNMYDKLADITVAMIEGERFSASEQSNVRVLPPAGLFVRTIAEVRRMVHALETGRLKRVQS